MLQFNKIDLPNRINSKILQKNLNFFNVPQFESVATQGAGVFETLKSIINLVVKNIQGGV